MVFNRALTKWASLSAKATLLHRPKDPVETEMGLLLPFKASCGGKVTKSTFTEYLITWRTLLRSLPLIWRAAPTQVAVLMLLLAVQGSVPAAAVYLTKLTIDGITNILQGGEASLATLAVLWSATAAANYLLPPVVQLFQVNVAELLTAHINLSLMRKSEELVGLKLLEDPHYHDDLQVLQEGARNKPVNMVVLLLYSIRNMIATMSLAIVLATLAWWVPLIVTISAIPFSIATLRMQKHSWGALLSRSSEARRMEYDSKLALSTEHAPEVRLYNMLPWLRDRYNASFQVAHQTMKAARVKQTTAVLPSILLSIGVAASLFVWTITQAGRGN